MHHASDQFLEILVEWQFMSPAQRDEVLAIKRMSRLDASLGSSTLSNPQRQAIGEYLESFRERKSEFPDMPQAIEAINANLPENEKITDKVRFPQAKSVGTIIYENHNLVAYPDVAPELLSFAAAYQSATRMLRLAGTITSTGIDESSYQKAMEYSGGRTPFTMDERNHFVPDPDAEFFRNLPTRAPGFVGPLQATSGVFQTMVHALHSYAPEAVELPEVQAAAKAARKMANQSIRQIASTFHTLAETSEEPVKKHYSTLATKMQEGLPDMRLADLGVPKEGWKALIFQGMITLLDYIGFSYDKQRDEYNPREGKLGDTARSIANWFKDGAYAMDAPSNFGKDLFQGAEQTLEYLPSDGALPPELSPARLKELSTFVSERKALAGLVPKHNDRKSTHAESAISRAVQEQERLGGLPAGFAPKDAPGRA
jgi:hypothetical protein